MTLSKRPGRRTAGSIASGRFGGGQAENGLAGIEAVHLNEQLRDEPVGKLIFGSSATDRRNRIKLVKEDDARAGIAGLHEKFTKLFLCFAHEF